MFYHSNVQFAVTEQRGNTMEQHRVTDARDSSEDLSEKITSTLAGVNYKQCFNNILRNFYTTFHNLN